MGETGAFAEISFSPFRKDKKPKNNIQIKTTEHFLAACWHLSIDNLEIEINNEELPILDGSSSLFIKALNKAGIKEQKKHQLPACQLNCAREPSSRFKCLADVQKPE